MDGRILGMSPLQSGQEAVIHSEYIPGSPEETEDRWEEKPASGIYNLDIAYEFMTFDLKQ